MRYKAILWDLDGTLLDTLTDLANSVNATLHAHGMPTHTEDAICSFVGNGMRRLIERAVPAGTDDDTVLCVLDAFNTHYAAHCRDHTAPYPGILPLLKQVKEAGILSAVVSNKSDYAVKPLVADSFPGLIEVAIGAREDLPRKPDPSMVRLALEQLGVSAKEVLYVGDSEVDVATARNAGLTAAFVTWGFRTTEQLKAAGADVCIDTVEDLLSYIISC